MQSRAVASVESKIATRQPKENVRRIQESFEHTPRKSTHRGSRELGIPQPTVWRVLRHRLLFKPYRLQLVQALSVHLFETPCSSSHCILYAKVPINRSQKHFIIKNKITATNFSTYQETFRPHTIIHKDSFTNQMCNIV